MSGRPAWRLLPAAAPGIPTLLVSTAFTSDSYSVHLSDLANVWTESLDKRPIITRGAVEDTSIDLSDGSDQIRKMLELLRAAFNTDDPEHPNTSLTLARGADGDSLVVNVTCLLPKPLKPFRWPMHLKKCPQSTVATELVLPLIQAHEARMRDIDHLVSMLREKDGVIARLIDKLDATGIGLEHVFHALSGKRRVTRAAAEEKVKALAPFSESDFRSRTTELHPVSQSSDISTLLGAVFGTAGLHYKSDLDLEASTVLNDWWTKLARGRNIVLSERPDKQGAQAPPPPPEDSESTRGDDDDFQVQATPPGAPAARNRGSPTRPGPADDDETSDGEDALDNATSPPPPPTASAVGRASGSRLGAIGRHKRPSTSPPPARMSQRASTARKPPSDADSETTSEADENDLNASPPPSPPKHPPRRGGLGRIGGKTERVTAGTRSTRSPSPAPLPPEEPSQLPRRHKLGMIGKKAPSPGPEASAAGPSEDARGRLESAASDSKKEQPRETSQERADRKRAELQRDLEKRAAAGPAKKKRRF